MPETERLPHWQVTTLFPSLDSPEFAAAFEKARRDVQDLVPIFDARGIRRREPGAPTLEEVAAYEEVTGALNRLYADLRLVRAYLSAFTSTDARNETAQSLSSELRTSQVTLGQ